MIEQKDIISLEQASAAEAHLGGGKFAGLAQIKPLLEKYNQQYGAKFDLPPTYAITTAAYDKSVIARKGVPEEIVNQAMNCLVACGGNVAVRSSADIEDKGGKTHSGDWLRIDLRTGQFKAYPQQDKTFNIANLVQMVKNSKNK